MTALFYSSLTQIIGIVGIILWAFLFREPQYTDYMRGGAWTPEKSRLAATNRLVYTHRNVRRGALVGLGFGCVAALVTWVIR